jgi:hypothetical protein
MLGGGAGLPKERYSRSKEKPGEKGLGAHEKANLYEMRKRGEAIIISKSVLAMLIELLSMSADR